VRENGSTEIVVPVLINPDRAPHGVTGEAEHPARKFDACAWPLAPRTMTLGQVVRVPTADGTTHTVVMQSLFFPFGKVKSIDRQASDSES
jgi:hypothetical protein